MILLGSVLMLASPCGALQHLFRVRRVAPDYFDDESSDFWQRESHHRPGTWILGPFLALITLRNA